MAGDEWCEDPSGRRPSGEEKKKNESMVQMKEETSYEKSRHAFFFDIGGGCRCLLHVNINNDENLLNIHSEMPGPVPGALCILSHLTFTTIL